MEFDQIYLDDYLYDLPDDYIARYPLKERDASKLLVYKGKEGSIQHEQFRNIAHYLPTTTALFFNNTRVIPARLLFEKTTGALIEIFLLQPKAPSEEIATAMQVKDRTTWLCMVRNLKKWKHQELLTKTVTHQDITFTISAKLLDSTQQLVALAWDKPMTFSEVLELLGEIPLPPYLKRKAETRDRSTYQTVYSEKEGAVAAPTAGLHFTPEVLKHLQQKGISTHFLTLHVSAGTFQPIKEKEIIRHPMHTEQMVVSRENVQALYEGQTIVAVGTTSMRTLESLYWFGVRLHLEGHEQFLIEKLTPYQYDEHELPSKEEAMKAILDFMDRKSLSTISGETSIFIFPGYTFRICQGLITNFHQPGSTLILLVAAFIGKDWRKIYETALNNNYRFLSYGDSSLLLPGF